MGSEALSQNTFSDGSSKAQQRITKSEHSSRSLGECSAPTLPAAACREPAEGTGRRGQPGGRFSAEKGQGMGPGPGIGAGGAASSLGMQAGVLREPASSGRAVPGDEPPAGRAAGQSSCGDTAPRIPHPKSHIPHPTSHIPHPASPSPHPALRTPLRRRSPPLRSVAPPPRQPLGRAPPGPGAAGGAGGRGPLQGPAALPAPGLSPAPLRFVARALQRPRSAPTPPSRRMLESRHGFTGNWLLFCGVFVRE